MPTLSVIISTKNHASIVERALKSVEFADEIVVIDLHSQDETVKIAQKYTDKIYQHQDFGYIEPVRNFSLEKASGDWVLILDADEEVSPGLKKAIQAVVTAENQAELPDCFYLPRKNIIFDSWLQSSGWWPDLQLRFFRQDHVQWSDKIHSIPITKGEVKEFPAQEKLALIHHNYQRIDQCIERLNRYTKIQAQEKIETGQEMSAELAAAETLSAFKDEFFRRFFLEAGLDDGPHGFSLSFLQAVSEAVLPLKLWEQAGFPKLDDEDQLAQHRTKLLKEFAQFKKELNYWLADAHCKQSWGLKKLYWRIRRKWRM